MRTAAALLLIAVAWFATGVRAAGTCEAPAAVCAVRERVFAVSSFDPEASATLIGPELLVTNRHVVADSARATLKRAGGSVVEARVVPTSYAGDLVLLRAPGLGDGAEDAFETAAAGPKTELRTVAADVADGGIRVYAPGRVIIAPAEGAPLARLHHTAPSLPGNSGGALVDDEGRLVGIVTSGGQGRYEAIPATELAALKEQSGPDHAAASVRIGRAYRDCVETLDKAGPGRALDGAELDRLEERCTASGNRQLIDLAGQAFGRQRLYAEAARLFEGALAQDPNAINTRLSLAITLHLARRFADEVRHLNRLITVLPSDRQVLTLSLQAGKWGGDEDLALRAFALLAAHYPNQAAAARQFMDNPPPPPKSP